MLEEISNAAKKDNLKICSYLLTQRMPDSDNKEISIVTKRMLRRLYFKDLLDGKMSPCGPACQILPGAQAYEECIKEYMICYIFEGLRDDDQIHLITVV